VDGEEKQQERRRGFYSSLCFSRDTTIGIDVVLERDMHCQAKKIKRATDLPSMAHASQCFRTLILKRAIYRSAGTEGQDIGIER
jgi:hypothetical protein